MVQEPELRTGLNLEDGGYRCAALVKGLLFPWTELEKD